MSFSREVKLELCQNQIDGCCKKAFISAIIKMNSSLVINKQGITINISFESVAIIRYIYEILKDVYQIETQIVVSKQMKLKKNNTYTLKIVNKALEILTDLKLMENMCFSPNINQVYYQNECCHKNYLAGSFVAAGSVNSPEKANYHLEIQSDDQEYLSNLAKFIDVINKGKYPLDINFKMIKRRNNYLLYLKSAREIVDFLNYIGAINNTFKFEDIRMQRDFINSLNRMNNMDVANEQKTQKAANKQLEYINIINNNMGIDKLDLKLLKVVKLRMENKEANLVELCELYNQRYDDKITKSGMNHRFRKIKEIATNLELRGVYNGKT